MVKVLVARAHSTGRTMAVTTDDGRRYSLHSSPSQFDHGEVARFGQIDREGLKPITRMVGPGLRTLSFTHTIASKDYQRSIEHVLTPLTRLARDGRRVRFVGGSAEYEQGVWWNIKALPVKVVQRALDNRISRAELSWELEEAVDVGTNLVRSTPKAKATRAESTARPTRPATRQHQVATGDTLFGIAARYLGQGEKWPDVFALNKGTVSNPNRIFPGQVLKIPGA